MTEFVVVITLKTFAQRSLILSLPRFHHCDGALWVHLNPSCAVVSRPFRVKIRTWMLIQGLFIGSKTLKIWIWTPDLETNFPLNLKEHLLPLPRNSNSSSDIIVGLRSAKLHRGEEVGRLVADSTFIRRYEVPSPTRIPYRGHVGAEV